MIFKPHAYQQYAIDRVINDEHVGLLLEMGLGKTAIVLHAIYELMYNRLEVSKVLVIAPLKVAEATWQEEAQKWDITRSLRFENVLGSLKTRVNALDSKADIYVINRENVSWLVDYHIANKRKWDFDMIVFDESSSFKNGTSKRFKAIKKVLPKTDRTVILTGTPAPNGMEDLWAQVYLLDRGERLGRYLSHYKERYFDYYPWRYELKLKKGSYESIQAKISDICVSMKTEDYLTLPEMVFEDRPVVLDDSAKRKYEQTEREMLLEVDGTEITVLSAGALTGKLLQLCGGSVYDADGDFHLIHDCKYKALEETFEGLNGESALVFYGYRHELQPIIAAAQTAGFKSNEVRLLKDAKDVSDFNSGACKVLIAHPSSASYGLNLQEGGHHIIWYTLTYNLEQYQQANARLHRQGQKYPTIVHRLLVKGGIDEDVVDALDKKTSSQDALMQALKARIKKAGDLKA